MLDSNRLPKYTLGSKGAALLLIGGILPTVIISISVGLILVFFKIDLQHSDLFLLVSNAVMWCVAIFAFDYFSCRPETGKKLNFNFSSKDFSTYLIIFPLMLGMMFIAETLTTLIPITGPFFGELYNYYNKYLEGLTGNISLMIFLAVIMAPLFEEIVFRGIVLKGLLNGGTKPQKAIWISSIVFGIIHGNPWQFVGAVLLGYVLGSVYYRTQSLLLPMLLHGFNNLCSTVLVYYFKNESFSETFKISQWAIFGIGTLLFIIFYFLLIKKYPSKKTLE